MGSRRCSRCETQWPLTKSYFTCPLCGIETKWSGAPAAVTKEAEAKADEAIAAVAEMERDMARAERLAEASGGLLTVADIVTAQRHPISG
jgi:hypothetical protein